MFPRNPVAAVALISSIVLVACSDFGSPAATRYAASPVPLEANAGASALFTEKELRLGSTVRPAFAAEATQTRLRFGPLPIDEQNLLTTSLAVASPPGTEGAEADPPVTFHIEAKGPREQRTLLTLRSGVDFPVGQWHPVRLPLPTDLGSPIQLDFVTEPAANQTEPENVAWAAPRRLHPEASDRPNVILLVLDTLRADRTSLHGHSRETTPFLRSLAKKGVTVEHMISPFPSTLTSHASIFTGLSPPRHGVYPGSNRIPDDLSTLARAFRDDGYVTGGFTEGGFVHSYFGFSNGFDVYDNGPGVDFTDEFKGASRLTFEQAANWAAENHRSRFFLFVQTYDVHTPFRPPESYRKAYAPNYEGRWETEFPPMAFFLINNQETEVAPEETEHIRALYDAEIRYLDDELASFWEQLESSGALHNTLVIITSDHGEDLLEHGWLGHGTTLYDPALHVPFVAIWPGHLPSGTRLDCQKSLVDLAPSVLDLAGLPAFSDADGISFAHALREGRCQQSRPAFSQAFNTAFELRGAPVSIVSMRDTKWKLVLHPNDGRVELYDLLKDPRETTNVAAQHEDLVAEMTATLKAYSEANQPGDERKDELAPDVEKQLRSLGYIQ